MKRILITTGNGMFGKALAHELIDKEVNLRIMVRDKSSCSITGPRVEIVTGDLDKPESLIPVMKGVDTVFLSSPIGPGIVEREAAVIEAAKAADTGQIIKIFGAVRHEGDKLDMMHVKVLEKLKDSGIGWTLISPNSVMETSLLGQAQSVKYVRALYGSSGHGKVGLVALKNIAEASSHVIMTDGHDGQNYELTGPEAIDMYEVATSFSAALDAKIDYIDLTEEQMTSMFMKFDKTMTPERMELEVLCHLRAWKEGRASLVTETYEKLTGKDPLSTEAWVQKHQELFRKGMWPMVLAKLMRRFS